LCQVPKAVKLAGIVGKIIPDSDCCSVKLFGCVDRAYVLGDYPLMQTLNPVDVKRRGSAHGNPQACDENYWRQDVLPHY
jgi:hypothetical protein